jgi:sugar lactone lactonase YvrE
LPIDNSVDFIGTYLTYLYALDSKNNQIYRYPRATGGFGDKKNWLKDTLSFATISDMTIDENIYLAQADKIIKLFKGSQQSFDFETSKTLVHFDKIFTTIDSSSLYVLDTQNSRIVQYVKTDGTITKQYFDEKLKKGISLAVDETNGIAYISTSSELISVSL